MMFRLPRRVTKVGEPGYDYNDEELEVAFLEALHQSGLGVSRVAIVIERSEAYIYTAGDREAVSSPTDTSCQREGTSQDGGNDVLHPSNASSSLVPTYTSLLLKVSPKRTRSC